MDVGIVEINWSDNQKLFRLEKGNDGALSINSIEV